KKLQEDLKRSLDDAQEGIKRAWSHRSGHGFASSDKSLKELEDANDVLVDKDARVVVRSNSDSVKTVVKSDDSGTLVIVSNPKPHLTSHDKEGKLIFDGEIDTKDQRKKLPKDLWERVKPLLDDASMDKKDKEE